MANPKSLAARYFGLLRAEGYRPKLERGDRAYASIPFKAEGLLFVLFVDEEDDAFFHLGLAYDLAPTWEDLAAAVSRANQLNEELKGVKVTIHAEDRSVRFHVEAFLDAPATMAILERSMAALRNASQAFFETSRERTHLDA